MSEIFGVIVQPLHEEIFHLRGLVEHLPAAYFLFEQERLAGSLLFRLRFRHAVGRVPGAGLHYALSLGVETAGRAEFIRVSAFAFAGHRFLLSTMCGRNIRFAENADAA